MRYDQYQMLQVSNFCYASLIEIVKVQSFIDSFLQDLPIHLEDPDDRINL